MRAKVTSAANDNFNILNFDIVPAPSSNLNI
jgi:hypothetical protein